MAKFLQVIETLLAFMTFAIGCGIILAIIEGIERRGFDARYLIALGGGLIVIYAGLRLLNLLNRANRARSAPSDPTVGGEEN